MLSIGDFSRLSIKTLRYYREFGLLLPEVVDQETGHRNHYVEAQVWDEAPLLPYGDGVHWERCRRAGAS
jgi:hypothetical protein